jgi:methyl-accepting chemotaxis protein
MGLRVSLIEQLPKGARLSAGSFADRHRLLTRVLWLHVGVLVVWAALVMVFHSGSFTVSNSMFGMDMGGSMGSSSKTLPFGVLAIVLLLPAAFGLLSHWAQTSAGKSQMTSLGLVSTSFVVITLAGGQINAHLHLYAILVFIALYQQWGPLLWTIVAVLIHHAIVGFIAPEWVFGEKLSFGDVVLMDAVHSGIVVLEVVAILSLWHFAEIAEAETLEISRHAEQDRLTSDAERRAVERAQAELERDRTVRFEKLTTELGREIADVHSGAGDVSKAVSSIHEQLEALTTAVQDIAARTQTAAATAQNGQIAAESASDQMSQLEKSISEISDVNGLIAQIASQTNLLALNATIEAARAGTAGTGFAVVAGEVKQMADQTGVSAERVERIVSTAVSETTSVAASFTATSTVVSDMRDLQVELAASVEEQAVTLSQVADALNSVTTASAAIFASLERMNSVVKSGTA